MTPAQVEQAARRRYNSVSDTGFYSQDEVFQLIYTAELELATKALVIEARDSSSVTTVNGTRGYSFPSLWIALKRVEYNGQKLKPITMREWDRLTLSNSTTTSTGSPLYYFVWNTTLYLDPIPDSAVSLVLYGYKEPTFLTTASTTLSTPTIFHMDLADYVTAELAAKDSNFEMAQYYAQRWEKKLESAKQWSRKRRRTDGFSTVQNIDDLSDTIIGLI